MKAVRCLLRSNPRLCPASTPPSITTVPVSAVPPYSNFSMSRRETREEYYSNLNRNIDKGTPRQLAAFHYSANVWIDHVTLPRHETTLPPSSITIFTWNVDFVTPMIKERLQSALTHIRHDHLNCRLDETPPPCCILLQEVHAGAIDAILQNPWIQKHFLVTPTSNRDWPMHNVYGNITLISHTVPVVAAWSLAFNNSTMCRNALMVDVQLSLPADETETEDSWGTGRVGAPRVATLRLANTHLESLQEGAMVRPIQLRLVAEELRKNPLGGIVCGDMNAIQPSDRHTPQETQLTDAYSGGESDEAGFTWGYQPISRYPPGRLDKILYTRCEAFTVSPCERVGVGLQVEGWGGWVSDHYGLRTTVSMNEGI